MHNALCASHIYLLDSSSYYFFLVFCILSYSSVSLLECSFKIILYSLVSIVLVLITLTLFLADLMFGIPTPPSFCINLHLFAQAIRRLRGNAESPLNKPCKIFYHISKEIARGFTEKNIEILRSKL